MSASTTPKALNWSLKTAVSLIPTLEKPDKQRKEEEGKEKSKSLPLLHC